MRKLIMAALGASLCASVAVAVEKNPSPLSANGYVITPSDDVPQVVSDIVRKMSDTKSKSADRPVVFKLSRVTDPSTINPGEPMPGYPPTGNKHIIDLLTKALNAGQPVILVPVEEGMGRPGGMPILGPGGVTVFFESPGVEAP